MRPDQVMAVLRSTSGDLVLVYNIKGLIERELNALYVVREVGFKKGKVAPFGFTVGGRMTLVSMFSQLYSEDPKPCNPVWIVWSPFLSRIQCRRESLYLLTS